MEAQTLPNNINSNQFFTILRIVKLHIFYD